jgi:hypothetical protein
VRCGGDGQAGEPDPDMLEGDAAHGDTRDAVARVPKVVTERPLALLAVRVALEEEVTQGAERDASAFDWKSAASACGRAAIRWRSSSAWMRIGQLLSWVVDETERRLPSRGNSNTGAVLRPSSRPRPIRRESDE